MVAQSLGALAHIPEVTIGGIGVQAFGSPRELAETIVHRMGAVLPGNAIAINPEKVMRARRDEGLRTLLNSATIRFADGAGVVWAMRRKGLIGNRVTGVDVWEQLVTVAAKNRVPVFLLGAKPEILEQTVARLEREVPGICVAMAKHGYISDGDVAAFAASLARAGPAVVSVAMGSPKQERIIERLQTAAPQAFFIGVGGTFDCYVGAVPRAPLVWRKANLEWLYRLISQPSRIRRQWVLLPYVALTLAGRI